ncbi:unnamed protein product, partial [Effrenium voratum]
QAPVLEPAMIATLEAAIRNSHDATVTAVRTALSQQVQEVQMLTSYSARRVLPTLAMLVGMDPSETLALSDWQLKPADEQSAMPLRYSSARYHVSVRVKLLL